MHLSFESTLNAQPTVLLDSYAFGCAEFKKNFKNVTQLFFTFEYIECEKFI